MFKIITTAVLGLTLAVASAGVSSAQATDHCPEHNNPVHTKVEYPSEPEVTTVTFPAGTQFCVKAATSTSGIITSDGNPWTVNWTNRGGNTPGISYHVVYNFTPPTTEPPVTTAPPTTEPEPPVTTLPEPPEEPTEPEETPPVTTEPEEVIEVPEEPVEEVEVLPETPVEPEVTTPATQPDEQEAITMLPSTGTSTALLSLIALGLMTLGFGVRRLSA